MSSGDPLLVAVIQHQWFVRCGPSKSDSDNDGQPDWTVPVDGDYAPAPSAADDLKRIKTIKVSASLLDTGGMLGGGGCPSLPTVHIGHWAAVDFDGPTWCMIVSYMRAVVILVGAYQALRILMGGV